MHSSRRNRAKYHVARTNELSPERLRTRKRLGFSRYVCDFVITLRLALFLLKTFKKSLFSILWNRRLLRCVQITPINDREIVKIPNLDCDHVSSFSPETAKWDDRDWKNLLSSLLLKLGMIFYSSSRKRFCYLTLVKKKNNNSFQPLHNNKVVVTIN